MERLSRFLAQAGVASRRQAEVLISSGRVRVNGQVVETLGTQVDPERDVIMVNNRKVVREALVYYAVHKPIGYVSTVRDAHAAKRVVDLVPPRPRVYPVGRLDKDSSGLIVLTNDGDYAQRLMHPRFESKKVYRVTIDGAIDTALATLRKGVRLTEGIARADAIERVDEHTFDITTHQGWNRQVRRMVATCGGRVVSLVRIAEGRVHLGSLKEGAYRMLTEEERNS